MITKRHSSWVCAIALGLVTGGAFAADADSKLALMAKKLATSKQFSVSIHMTYDVVQESGRQIEFSELRKVLVSRPNHLRVDVRQSDGDLGRLVFDGKVLTQFNATENAYSQTARPGDLDAAVRYAVGRLGMRVPLARMLVTTFPEELEKLSENVDHVERNTLGDTPTDHIAGQTSGVDFQVWIADDSLPRRIVLTYKNAPGQPQFRAEFSNWTLAPEIPDATFAFTPPNGAEKIPTLLPASQPKAETKK